MSEILRAEHIVKIYGNGVMANKDINFSAEKGEIHAICGENGAGAFCRVQRTPMRFRADAVQSTTDALKQCIFSYSRGFITTV